jgi:hypothetical protein
VTVGLYRVSRNPMYVGVLLLLWGWALGFRSRALAIYALIVMLGFHLRVVFGEEPWLAQRHGEEWDRYRATVPRWFGLDGPRCAPLWTWAGASVDLACHGLAEDHPMSDTSRRD